MPDWTKFDQYPEDTVSCRCGMLFRSHAAIDKDTFRIVLRKPCPRCGRTDDAWKVSSDPESMTI